MRNFIICMILLAASVFAQPKFERTNSAPGEFSRYGFGARGIGMGNSISALKNGNISSYYNPALVVFQKDNHTSISGAALSHDRMLNSLGFTRRFEFFAKDDTTENRKPRSTAGISAGIINFGISNIDGRDNQGLKTKDLSVSENQFFLAFANKFSEKISAGVAVKFYYFDFYDKATSNTLGFDIGIVYTYSDNLSFAAVIQDLNASYKWDTSELYGNSGTTTTDRFPLAKKFGAAYKFADIPLCITAEYEFNNMERKMLRFGGEYALIPELTLRAGLDKWHIKNSDESSVPSFGFSYNFELAGLQPGIDYAVAPEQFSGGLRHYFGISINF
ncbi:MAG: hypothetical protein AMXMBFR48_02300 [Ignavibacteriales bacterium]